MLKGQCPCCKEGFTGDCCFLTGRTLATSDGREELGGVREHLPWHYCAFVCRVLATPDFARSPIERHVARSLAGGRGTEWMPYTGNPVVPP